MYPSTFRSTARLSSICERLEARQLLANVWVDGAFQQWTTLELDSAIANMGPALNKNIYSSGTTLNPDNWAKLAGYNQQCISYSNPTTTVISPDGLFAVQAQHYSAGSATWVGLDGNTYSRTVVAAYNVPNTDIRIVKLNSALPASLGYALLGPSNLGDFLPPRDKPGSPGYFTIELPGLCLDQEKKSLVSDMYLFTPGGGVGFEAPSETQRAQFYEIKINGDSGSPAFLLLPGGQLMIMTAWTGSNFEDREWGPEYSGQYSAIATWITQQGGTVPVVADLAMATLRVDGTSAGDVITISQSGAQFTITVNGDQQVVNSVDVAFIAVNGFDGADSITLDSSVTLPTTIYGGSGNDTITGGTGDDQVYGDTGDDVIYGGSGNDTITGMASGGGQDTIYAGNGADLVDYSMATTGLIQAHGGAGNDTIKAGVNGNSIWGDEGDDVIYGGSGNDTITGMASGGGQDTIYAGNGADLVDYSMATTGLIQAHGGVGNDTIKAGVNGNTLWGDDDADSIIGGSGNDTIYGGNGNDTLTGGNGSDSILGEAGNDVFYLADGFVDTANGGLDVDSVLSSDPGDVLSNM